MPLDVVGLTPVVNFKTTPYSLSVSKASPCMPNPQKIPNSIRIGNTWKTNASIAESAAVISFNGLESNTGRSS